MYNGRDPYGVGGYSIPYRGAEKSERGTRAFRGERVDLMYSCGAQDFPFDILQMEFEEKPSETTDTNRREDWERPKVVIRKDEE